MNVASILSKSYRLTNTNATTFLDGNSTNVLADLNTCYGQRTLKILRVKQDLNHAINEQYTTLVSTDGLAIGDTGYNGEYPFDSATLRPVRVEVSFDGTTWNPAQVYDINDNINSSEFNEDQIQATFSESYPYVRFERDSYFIRPLKTSTGNITGGIHLWTEERQTALTTGEPAFESNLHDLLSYDLAELEALMHPKKYDVMWWNAFRGKKNELEELFNEFYKNRFKRNMGFSVDYSSTFNNYK